MQSTFDFRRAAPKLPNAMARLAQILASHGSILVLDAASGRVQVGLLRAGQSASWLVGVEEAGKGVFTGTSVLLEETALALDEIAAFAYCEGPGSMLGIRTIAMTLRTWLTLNNRPVYAYQSLALAARAEWARRPRGFTVIADARRDTWHAQSIAPDGTLAPLRRLPAPELPAGELLTPEHFRAWSQPPPCTVCGYDLAALFPLVASDDILVETPMPDTFQHDAPGYKKWSAQPHSADTASRR